MKHLQPYSLFESVVNPNKFGLLVICRQLDCYPHVFDIYYSISQPTVENAMKVLSDRIYETVFNVTEYFSNPDINPEAARSEIDPSEIKANQIIKSIAGVKTESQLKSVLGKISFEMVGNKDLFEIYWGLTPNPIKTKTLISIGEDVEDIDNFQPANHEFYLFDSPEDEDYYHPFESDDYEDVNRVNHVLFANPPKI